MNTQIFRKAACMSRVLMGGAALAIVAAIAPGAALAQGKSNIAGCTTFSSFNYDAGTNTLTVVNCGGIVVNDPIVSTPSAYSVSASAASATAGTAMTVTIQRTGGNAAASLEIFVGANALTGWSFAGSGVNISAPSLQTLTFADREMVKSFNFNPGSTPGIIGISLGAVTGIAGSTSGGSLVIEVKAGAPVVQPPPGCPTVANYSNTFTVVGQKFVYSLKPGESGATGFVARPNSMAELSTSDTVNTPPGADHEIVIAACPGDFTPLAPACRLSSLYKGGVVRTTTTGQPDYYCQLQADKTYYMNVRQVRYGTTVPSCDNASCEVKVQLQNY